MSDLEPLYELQEAFRLRLTPFSTLGALKAFLWRNRANYKPLYRVKGPRSVRILSMSDLLRMRAQCLKPERPRQHPTR